MKLLTFVFLRLALVVGVAASTMAAQPERNANLEQLLTTAASYELGQSGEAFRGIDEALRQSIADKALRQEVEAGLVRLLGPDTSFEAKKFACELLGIIGSPTALPPLSRLLDDPETTSLACRALGSYPPGKADGILREALNWAHGKARIQIINTLGERRDSRALEQLSKSALEKDTAIAEAAIAALGKIETPAAWKAIAALNGIADPALSGVLAEATLRAAEGFAASHDWKRAKLLYEELLAKSDIPAVRRSALAVLLTLDADGGEDRIVETLSGSDKALIPAAIAAISRVPSSGASEKFTAQLHHLKPEEQALMIESLAKRNDDSARLALAKALSSTEPLPRRAAIVALGRLGDPYFAGLLARCAALASDPEENRAIESALVGLRGGAETDNRLMAELKTAPPKSRIVLMGAIMRRQGAAANPLLLEETANTDPAVAKAAFRALAKSGTAKDAAPLLTKLTAVYEASVRSEAESAAAQVLARLEDTSRRSSLVREALAKATTVESKTSLIGLLPTCANAEALTALKTAAADSESQVREAAVRTLSDWPDASACEALLALYRQESGSLHGLALRGLVRLVTEQNANPEPGVLERYRALIGGAKGAGDLKLILAALGGYGHPEALPLALPLLSDPSVRAEAIEAVRRIAEASKTQNPQLAEEALKRLPNP